MAPHTRAQYRLTSHVFYSRSLCLSQYHIWLNQMLYESTNDSTIKIWKFFTDEGTPTQTQNTFKRSLYGFLFVGSSGEFRLMCLAVIIGFMRRHCIYCRRITQIIIEILRVVCIFLANVTNDDDNEIAMSKTEYYSFKGHWLELRYEIRTNPSMIRAHNWSTGRTLCGSKYE